MCDDDVMTRGFRELITPADPGFLPLARQIHEGRADLGAAYPDPLDVGFRKWLGVNGLLEYPDQLSRFYPPVPPESLRSTACGAGSQHSHLYSSVEDFETVIDLWEVYGDGPLPEVGAIFDFGCGCGRLMRWISLNHPAEQCLASDVRAASVEWCSENLRGRYFVNDPQPPLQLEDASVDLIIALSVFSHLHRSSNLAWLRELARVCKPGRLMLLSTHGAFSLAVIRRSVEHQDCLEMDSTLAREYLRRLEIESFVFHPLRSETVTRADGVEEQYGNTFFTHRFVEREWSPYVDVVGYVPARLGLFQDMYIVRSK